MYEYAGFEKPVGVEEPHQPLNDKAAALRDKAESLNERIAKIIGRVDGPKPERVAKGSDAMVPPASCLRLSVERAANVLQRCHDQLDELEKHIG